VKDEIATAHRLIHHTKQVTQRLMEDVKLGKPLDMPQVEEIVEKVTESVLNNKDALISLARIKKKDEYTYMHSLAVSALCISFGEYVGSDQKQLKHLGIGGLLHDIGKVKVPDQILNKPGPLTASEFEVMKLHVSHGTCILHEIKIDENAVGLTADHHERLDGSGYPAGLRGDQISFFGQLAAVVDIYDALTSERCYKAAIPPTQALRKLFEWTESYLSRELVEKFISHIGIYPIGTLVRLSNGLLAVVIDHGERGLLHPIVRSVYDARRRERVKPSIIDLSKGNSHRIVGCESPDRWNIRPESYLMN
jgi:cyclic di-GMP phosphodiesterase